MKRNPRPALPQFVAAYACGLWCASISATWVDVARALEAMGLGVHDFRDVARAALSFGRTNLSRGAWKKLRQDRAQYRNRSLPFVQRRKAVRS